MDSRDFHVPDEPTRTQQRMAGSHAVTSAGRDWSGRTAVAGVFPDAEGAGRAIDELRAEGFPADQIGVAARDRTVQGDLIEETGTSATEGAVSGAVGGGVLGGIVGLMVGVGALALPGIGPVLAGGALATAFGIAGGTAIAGAGIGAAAGGILGAMVGMGIPEEEAAYFEQGFQAGGVLVTVNAGNRPAEAAAILERHGADTGPARVPAEAPAEDTLVAADEGRLPSDAPTHQPRRGNI